MGFEEDQIEVAVEASAGQGFNKALQILLSSMVGHHLYPRFKLCCQMLLITAVRVACLIGFLSDH